MSSKDNRLILYEKISDLIIYSKNLLNKYPKSERFDLCTDIKNKLYRCLECIMYAIKAENVNERYKYLKEVDVNLYVLKTLVKMSFEFKYISPKNYMVWDNHITEIGKMVGGWIKKCQKE
jgi:hypothetical protein